MDLPKPYYSFTCWEQETTAANKYFDNSDFLAAESKYKNAKSLALNLFKQQMQPERAIAAVVVSFHNLSNLYQKKKQLRLAYEELDAVDAYLANYLNTAVEDPEIMRAVRLGLDQTRAELFGFIKKNKLVPFADNLVHFSPSTKQLQ